jgi:hypothetical protein
MEFTYTIENWTISKLLDLLENNKFCKLPHQRNLKLKNQNHADKVTNLLAYIHSKHKEWEIELDLPINDSLSISND